MSDVAGWLTSLVVVVQGLGGDRAPELLAALAPAVRAAGASSSADFAGLARAERHRRLAELGVGAPDPDEITRRLTRLPPGLRAAVIRELPLALRPRTMPGVAANTAQAVSSWGARLAREWTAVRPRSAGAPSPPRDTRAAPVGCPRAWPAC